MADLKFMYGTMGSGKSGRIIDTAYSFRSSGKRVEALKPAFDNRDSDKAIVSRSRNTRLPAIVLKNLDNYKPQPGTQFILVDEVQFFSPSDIKTLVRIANTTPIIVMCYGLLLDSDETMFPASAALIQSGAELEEMKTCCQINGCINHATHHLRFDGAGNVVRRAAQCQVGDSAYKSVCRQHFYKMYYGMGPKSK